MTKSSEIIKPSGSIKFEVFDSLPDDSEEIAQLLLNISNASTTISPVLSPITNKAKEDPKPKASFTVRVVSKRMLADPDEVVQKKFKCSECVYQTNKRSHLTRHTRTHTGEKPYRCDECEYATAHNTSLSIHKRTHSGVRPFKCDECEYAARQKNDLVVHKRSHTGEKPFKCHLCSYAAAQKRVLNKHISRKHAEEKDEEDSEKVDVSEEVD